MERLPREFHRLFWDCDASGLDVERNAPLILEGLLDHGELAAARWSLAHYGKERLRAFLVTRGRKTLSRMTIAFWRAVLDLEDEPCLKQSSLRSSNPFRSI